MGQNLTLPIANPVRIPESGSISDELRSAAHSEDAQITLAVMNALHWDLAVPRDRVRVRVESGWVTLSGRVERGYSRTAAEADARAASGVKGVTNAIEVEA